MSRGLEHVVTEGDVSTVSETNAVLQCHIVEAYLEVPEGGYVIDFSITGSWFPVAAKVGSKVALHHTSHIHCCFPKGRKGWARNSSVRAFFRPSACLRSFHCAASCSLILWEERRKEHSGRTCSAGCHLSPEIILRCDSWRASEQRDVNDAWVPGVGGSCGLMNRRDEGCWL